MLLFIYSVKREIGSHHIDNNFTLLVIVLKIYDSSGLNIFDSDFSVFKEVTLQIQVNLSATFLNNAANGFKSGERCRLIDGGLFSRYSIGRN